MPDRLDDLIRHDYADLDDVRLHYVEAAPAEAADAPLVILLHGFPEFWYSWRHQIPALVAAGWRVVAPDMRGYNLSDKPRGVASYRLEHLSGDVKQLIAHLQDGRAGQDKAVVVGHDWGAAVAWDFAARHPEHLVRLAILNVPHPVAMQRGLKTLRQLKKSWYILAFQLPWLPEKLAAAGDYKMVRDALQKTVRPGAMDTADVERYVEAMAQPGALTGAINYYRAAGRDPSSTCVRTIEAPVLVIWGMQDFALGSELAEPPAKWVPHARVERIAEASHWVQLDAPERVNALLVDFLAEATWSPRATGS